MGRLVGFEDKMVSVDSIPQGSLFIMGMWYASADALPEDLKDQYSELFKRSDDGESGSQLG